MEFFAGSFCVCGGRDETMQIKDTVMIIVEYSYAKVLPFSCMNVCMCVCVCAGVPIVLK